MVMVFMLYNCSCIDDDFSCSIIFYDDIIVVFISMDTHTYIQERKKCVRLSSVTAW